MKYSVRSYLFATFVFVCNATVTQAQLFAERSQEMGINHTMKARVLVGGGAAFFDYDNDGDEDVYITAGLNPDHLYRNNGDGTFTKVTNDVGFGITQFYNTLGVTTGDIDNDGDRDVFVTTWEYSPTFADGNNLLFLNNGNGTFSYVSPTAGIMETSYSNGATFWDFDKDGYLDLYVANHIRETSFTFDSTGVLNGYAHDCYPNFLYHNNGDGTFTEVAAKYGMDNKGCSLALVASDFDGDSDLDMYVANDFGGYVLPNALFENQSPQDSFLEIGGERGADIGIYGMGIASGDYDLDLDIDYYITNIGRNVLIENEGGYFTDVTTFAGVENAITEEEGLNTTGWGTAFLDVDNDIWPDLFVANGRIPAAHFNATAMNDPNKLYKNNGDKTFTDITEEAGVGDISYGRGMAYSDFDHDGDLDVMVVVLDELGGTTKFYVNEIENDNHYVQFKLIGTETNRDGFGSKIWLYAGGQTFLQEIYAGGNVFCSQNSSIAHFGLGEIEQIDSVRIEWLNGQVDVLEGLKVDELHNIVEGGGVTAIKSSIQKEQLTIQTFPNPFEHEIFVQLTDYESTIPANIRLMNLHGQVVFKANTVLTKSPVSLDIAVVKLPVGVYFLEVCTEDFQTTQKVVKLKN